MPFVAALNSPDAAGELLRQLGAASIPAEIRTVTHEESGLEFSEVHVDDTHFEKACELADAWQTEAEAAWNQKYGTPCWKCGSKNIERIPHDKLEAVRRCKDCGAEFE
jgi:hypothetical protein